MAAPQAAWPPTFAETFVTQARRLLDLSRVLMIVGPVGGSCQSLAAEITQLPTGSSAPHWSRHVAYVGDDQRPFHALGQIFGADAAQLTTINAAEQAVRADLNRLDLDHSALPTVIVANAGHCDRESIEVLRSLANAGELRLIVTLTPETQDVHGSLHESAEVIDLPPLEPRAISDLIVARYSVTPDPALVERLAERTGGSYDVLREIVDAGCRSRQLVPRDELLVAADATSEHGTDSRDLAHLIAILGALDCADASRLFGADAIFAATAGGTFAINDESLTYTSAAERAKAHFLLPRAQLSDLFDRFADQLGGTLERPGTAIAAARWWRATGRPVTPELAARAAREANLAGLPRLAITLTEPAANTDQTAVAPLERVYAMNELGNLAGIEATWESITPEHLSEDELVPYFRWAAARPDLADRAVILARAVTANTPEAARRRATVRELVDLLDQTHDDLGPQRIDRLRTFAFSDELSTRNRALTLTALGSALLNSGRPVQAAEMGQLAQEILSLTPDRVSAFHLDQVRELHGLALVFALDLDAAERTLVSYGPAGSPRRVAMLQGLLDLANGNLDGAITNTRLSLAYLQRHDPQHVRGWTQAHLSQLLMRSQRPDAARVALAAADVRPSPITAYDLERRTAQASTLDALAEPEDALALLADVIAEARHRDLRLVQIIAAGRSVLIGGPPHVNVLTQTVGGLKDLTGAPAVWQDFARAAHSYDIATLTRLVARLADIHAFSLAADFAQFVLDMSRRASDLEPTVRAWLLKLTNPQAQHRQRLAG